MTQLESEMISTRAERIGSFIAMDLLNKARKLEAEGRNIIHMELGEPDRPPPPHVVDAAVQALRNGFSKVYGMTGWRLGWIICPKESAPALHKIHQNFFLSANSFVQKASVTALDGPQDYVDETIKIYDDRRRYLIDELNKIGWRLGSEPQGAFYLLADASSTGLDGLTLAGKLLEEADVAVTPGIDFGKISNITSAFHTPRLLNISKIE